MPPDGILQFCCTMTEKNHVKLNWKHLEVTFVWGHFFVMFAKEQFAQKKLFSEN